MPREKFYYLEHLQDIGDRYSPKVFRDYFLTQTARRPAGPTPSTLSQYINVSECELTKLHHFLQFNVINFILSVYIGAILFLFSTCWFTETAIDPVRSHERIANGLPNMISIVLVFYGFVISIVSETYLGRRFFNKFDSRSIFLTASSVFTQASFIIDLLAAVVLVRCADRLFVYVTSCALLIQIVFIGLIVPLSGAALLTRTAFSTVTLVPAMAARRWEGGSEDDEDNVCVENQFLARATTLSSLNVEQLQRLAFMSVANRWRLFSYIICSRLGSVCMEFPLILQNDVLGYMNCFTYQMILIPLKIFFLLDYGFNSLVFVSVPLSFLSSLLVCITNVFPLPPIQVVTSREEELLDVV